ncbi:hypothetical protein IPG41_02520 [Candidatus Peregrinibacteria bacterium]|nr:MAG: hypothetical protein IPG41_02520 [Candidatus Peregrinibacteria bacterium]
MEASPSPNGPLPNAAVVFKELLSMEGATPSLGQALEWAGSDPHRFLYLLGVTDYCVRNEGWTPRDGVPQQTLLDLF